MANEISWNLKPADQTTFTGEAHSRMIAGADADVPIKLYFVRFAPGARTHWHAHSGAQILIVVSGRCHYQREGEEVREAGAGESVRFEPGERHWHGGSPTDGTEHVAVNLDNRQTTWLEAVDDADYR